MHIVQGKMQGNVDSTALWKYHFLLKNDNPISMGDRVKVRDRNPIHEMAMGQTCNTFYNISVE
jgi:hypothetical protein